MKHKLLLFFALALPFVSAQNIDTLTALPGANVDAANDYIVIRDASVTTGNKIFKLKLDQHVDIPGFFGSVSKAELLNLDNSTGNIQTQLDLKAPLASPTFTGTVGGITSSMVGLGNVENTALSTWAGSANITTLGTITSGTVPVARVSGLGSFATGTDAANLTGTVAAARVADGSLSIAKLATDPLNASNLSSGTVATARLGSGTANSTTFLRGDNTWQTVAAGGGTWGSITGTLSSQAEFSQGTRTVSSYTAAVPSSALDTLKLTGHQKVTDNQTHKLYRIANRMTQKTGGSSNSYSMRSMSFGDSVAYNMHSVLSRQFGYGGAHVPIGSASGTAPQAVGSFTLSPTGILRRLTSGQTVALTTGQYGALGIGFLASNTQVSGQTRGKFMVRYREGTSGNYTEYTAAFQPGRSIAGAYASTGSTATCLVGAPTLDYTAIRDGMSVSIPGVSHWPADTIIRYNPSPIRTVVITGAGTGYTNGTHTNISLTGGTGSGAVATVGVTAGAVSSVTMTTNGRGYTEGDLLSGAVPGAGSGFQLQVRGVHAEFVNATTGNPVTPSGTNAYAPNIRLQFPNSGSDGGNVDLYTNAGTNVAERIYDTYAPDSAESNYTQVWAVLPNAGRRYQVEVVCVSGAIELVDLVQDAGNFQQNGGFLSSGMNIDFAAGGTWLSQGGQGHEDITQNNMNRALWYYDPEIITYKTANGHPGPNGVFSTPWTTFTNKLKTAAPNATFIVYGTHPTGAVPSRTDALSRLGDDFFRRWCAESENSVFVDLRPAMPEPSWRTYTPDSFHSTSDLLHLANGAQQWQNALTRDLLDPVFNSINAQNATVTKPMTAPGTFHEIRMVDPDTFSDFQEVKPFSLVFPQVTEGVLRLASPASTTLGAWCGIGRTIPTGTNSTGEQLALYSNGAKLFQSAGSAGGIFGLNHAASAKADSGWRFAGTAGNSQTFTIESMNSIGNLGSMLRLDRVSSHLTNTGDPSWQWGGWGVRHRPVLQRQGTTNWSATVTAMPDTSGIEVGMRVFGAAVQPGTTVTQVPPTCTAGTIVMSASTIAGLANEMLHFTRPNDLHFTYANLTSNADVTVHTPLGVPGTHSGTAPDQTGMTTSQIKLASGASAIVNQYLGGSITITGGTGSGQTRTITAYNEMTKIATLATVWTTPPDATSTYTVTAGRVIAVAPSFSTNAAGLAAMQEGDLYYDEASGKTKARRPSTGTNAAVSVGSIAAGAIDTFTITVTGAAAGDTVHLGPPSAIEAGLMWSGFVSGADTVTVRLHNTTGSPIDPADSATWRAVVSEY